MGESKIIAIDVKNLSKSFHMTKSADAQNKGSNSFFALRDISFTLYKGEALSIIGSNGSGKTTLLKILSQITKPTSGEADFYGSVTSILDIGGNFHPDLTGRENVTMQLKIAHIKPNDFQGYYDRICAFSEIGDFFDQPVKVYSSGMFLRLAFSIAFHLSSDILILDEVLSVGDEGFRLKCQELIKMFTEAGKTILFVSHNRSEILELSNKCLWLDKGHIRKLGYPTEILSEYFTMHRDHYDQNKLVVEAENEQNQDSEQSNGTISLKWDEKSAPGNSVLTIRKLSVTSVEGNGTLYNDEPIEVVFLVDKKKAGIHIGAFFFLQDVFYQPVLVGHFLNASGENDFSGELKNKTGLFEIRCVIPANFLTPGKYFLFPRFGMEEWEWSSTSQEIFRFSEKLTFTIHARQDYIDFIGDVGKGAVRPALDWAIRQVEG